MQKGFLHIHRLRCVWHRVWLIAEVFADRPLWVPWRPGRTAATSRAEAAGSGPFQ